MWEVVKIVVFILLNIISIVICEINDDLLHRQAITMKLFAIWENATVPFYVNSDHFDHEQTTLILTALSMFAFKTCIKFMPVMAAPTKEEVLVFQNPEGMRRCVVRTDGHSVFGPHVLELGYDCLKSPNIDMMIMKSLGFTLEHNRVTRDNFIEVLYENIEPGAIDLFTKEDTLPMELRFLQYDFNSVMHFDQREYSRNGHRTIIFKDPNVKQNRVGLTSTDLKKIEIVYGPLCRARDRQEKIELCQSYPGVARKKREIKTQGIKQYEFETQTAKHEDEFQTQRNKREVKFEPQITKPDEIETNRNKREVETETHRSEIDEEELANKSLRINPDITVPPNLELDTDVKDLKVDEEIQQIIENVYKISAEALKDAKDKYCNASKPIETKENIEGDKPDSDVLAIVKAVDNYVQNVVDTALKNLTEFCQEPDMKLYQRSRYCNWGSNNCPTVYRSTKSGLPRFSTKHRPYIQLSTKNYRVPRPIYARSSNDTDLKESRRKRDVNDQSSDSNIDREIERNVDGDSPKKSDTENTRYKRYSSEDLNDSGETQSQDEEIIRPPKKVRNSNEVRRPKNERPWKPIKRPREKRPEDDERRPRERRPKERRPKESTEESSSVEKKRPMEIIDEWKQEEEKKKKKLRQKKRPDSMKVYDKEVEITRKPKKAHSDRERELPRTVKLSKANREFYNERMWPERTVWYLIQDDDHFDLKAMRSRIEEVNRILKRRTCVKLVEITPRQVNKYEDYLVLDASPDYVTGRVGGKQNFGSIELYRGDQHRQHTAMMVMAMLGFYFEVSRHDRDEHVRVHMRHVRPDKLHHFEKIRSDATLPLPYDYASATHPAWQFWRQLGHTGISTVATFKEHDPDGSIMKSLGQHEKLLSETDIIKINSVYGVKCFDKSRHRY